MTEGTMLLLTRINVTTTKDLTTSSLHQAAPEVKLFEGSWILPTAICVGILATFSIFAASLCYHQNTISKKKLLKQTERTNSNTLRRQPSRVWYRRGTYTLKTNSHPFHCISKESHCKSIRSLSILSAEQNPPSSNFQKKFQRSQTETLFMLRNLSSETLDKDTSKSSKETTITFSPTLSSFV